MTYNFEIYKHSLETEMKNVAQYETFVEKINLPNSEVNQKMRMVLVSWLFKVHSYEELSPETIFLAINILDRLLENTNVGKKLQLAGCACLLIASKYEDVYYPNLDSFVVVSDNSFDRTDLKDMESLISNNLEFRFTTPTPVYFAKVYIKLLFGHNPITSTQLSDIYLGATERTLYENKEAEISLDDYTVDDFYSQVFFFMKISLLNIEYLKYKPSEIAAGSCYLALKRYQIKWVDIKGIPSEKELTECVKCIYRSYKSVQGQIVSRIFEKDYKKLEKIATMMKEQNSALYIQKKVEKMKQEDIGADSNTENSDEESDDCDTEDE